MIEESSEGVAEDARGGWGSDDCGVRGGDVRRDKGASELDDANGGETDRLIGEIMEGVTCRQRRDRERRRRETTRDERDDEEIDRQRTAKTAQSTTTSRTPYDFPCSSPVIGRGRCRLPSRSAVHFRFGLIFAESGRDESGS